MNNRKIRAGAFTALATLLALSAGSAQAVTFSCKALMDSSEQAADSQMYASAINNRQQAVGFAFAPHEGVTEFGSAMWGKDRQAVRLNDEGDFFAVYSSASDINDAGVAVGVVWDRASKMRALTWTDGVLKELPGLPGGDGAAMAASINNRGKIAGYSRKMLSTGEVVERATLWVKGKPKDLGALKKTGESFATAINDEGMVVGYSSIAGAKAWVPARWIGGKVAALPVPDGAGGRAEAVNQTGAVVGMVSLPSEQGWRAYAWQDDAGAAMGSWPEFTSSSARAINDGGAAVGSALVAGSDAALAMYWPTVSAQPVDLNTLVDQAGCVDAFGVRRTLTSGVDINDKGVIVANAYEAVDGGVRSFSFRLTPR
ncbi:MAG TPA: hypothetical protein VFY73_11155 [Ideonella sp.]|uniref:hypothetical protein n=1 Tax=Ideonella sp. TaxID=1929293 RepID=UPI002E302C18|nr:hypothetical protein [Ideonella sp.]HEX5684579.1 hypothetical protein [Ideonella sp.]